jgi:hypothetical protein
MTQMIHDPAPGSRHAAAASAAAQAGELAELEQPAAEPQPAFTAVPVRHEGPVRTLRAASRTAAYSTVTLPASATLAPGVAQLLPRDDERVIAWILPIDGPIIIAPSKEQAQDPSNIGGTYPSGAYAPAGGYPVTHREQVWACNPSTTITCRVSVMIETGGGV